MRIRHVLALIGLCLCLSPSAWAGVDEAASAVCVKCHDAEDLPDMSRRAHAATTDKRTPTCVTCHGPSPTHVSKPSDAKERPHPDRLFSKSGGIPPNERSAVCLTCHDRDAKRALWAGSQHENADLACTSCHKIHTNNDKALSKFTQTDVCFTCHKEVRAQINKPSRHAIVEAQIACSDCHNVHGSAGPKLARRDSTNDTCYTCHAEKRGPFVHPHAPVVDDCANCHNPHGSTISAMLKTRPPMLCQQCHTPHVTGGVGAVGGQPGVFTPPVPGGVPAVTAISNGKNVVNTWQGRSCTNCHTQTHGSNNPSVTNPTPQFLFR